jgi:hypothetical protein
LRISLVAFCRSRASVNSRLRLVNSAFPNARLGLFGTLRAVGGTDFARSAIWVRPGPGKPYLRLACPIGGRPSSPSDNCDKERQHAAGPVCPAWRGNIGQAPKQPDDQGRLCWYRCPHRETRNMKWVWAALFVAVYAGGVVGSFEFFEVRFSCAILKGIDSKPADSVFGSTHSPGRTIWVVNLRVGRSSMRTSAIGEAADCQAPAHRKTLANARAE